MSSTRRGQLTSLTCACSAGCAELDATAASCEAAAATFAASTTTAVAAASTAAAAAAAVTRGASSGASAGATKAGSGWGTPAEGSRLRSMGGFACAGEPGRVIAGDGGAELAHRAPGRLAFGATTAGDGGCRCSWCAVARCPCACGCKGEAGGAATTVAAWCRAAARVVCAIHACTHVSTWVRDEVHVKVGSQVDAGVRVSASGVEKV